MTVIAREAMVMVGVVLVMCVLALALALKLHKILNSFPGMGMGAYDIYEPNCSIGFIGVTRFMHI